MNEDIFGIVINLAWGVITLGALLKGIARLQDSGLTGVRAFGAGLLFVALLILANGVALFFAAILSYCENCAGKGVRFWDLLVAFLLLLPSSLTWLVLAQSGPSENKRRWG